jgi:hypothetical protein
VCLQENRLLRLNFRLFVVLTPLQTSTPAIIRLPV